MQLSKVQPLQTPTLPQVFGPTQASPSLGTCPPGPAPAPRDSYQPGQPIDTQAAARRLAEIARQHHAMREKQGLPATIDGLAGDMHFNNMINNQLQQLQLVQRLQDIERTQGKEAARLELERVQAEARKQAEQPFPSWGQPFKPFHNSNSGAGSVDRVG